MKMGQSFVGARRPRPSCVATGRNMGGGVFFTNNILKSY